jgi:kinase-associated protein B
MDVTAVQCGQVVTIIFRTGQYIAKVMETHPEKALVQVLAVLRHPTQGDLHHPGQVQVPLFHQRKALAHMEKVMVPYAWMKPYDAEIPAYSDSLRVSLEKLRSELNAQRGEFAERSLKELEQLEREYFRE